MTTKSSEAKRFKESDSVAAELPTNYGTHFTEKRDLYHNLNNYDPNKPPVLGDSTHASDEDWAHIYEDIKHTKSLSPEERKQKLEKSDKSSKDFEQYLKEKYGKGGNKRKSITRRKSTTRRRMNKRRKTIRRR